MYGSPHDTRHIPLVDKRSLYLSCNHKRRISMRLTFIKSDLISAINTVSKAVPSKSTMDILECVLIDASEGRIMITANDMRFAIRTAVKGDIAEGGKIAVNAKLFSDIIRSFPDEDEIIIDEDNFNISIRSGGTDFNIMGLDWDSYPLVPEIKKDKYTCMSQYTLKEIINQTIFSISSDETVSPQMSGELMEVIDDRLRLVSLDGHRISIRNISLRDNYGNVKLIIPGKTLQEISRIIPDDMDKDVYIYYDNNHVLFEYGDTTVLSRLIEGEYYQVDRMISHDYESKIVVNRKRLLGAIERSTLLAKESDKKPLLFDIEDGIMEVSMKSYIGSMREELDIEKIGKDLIIGLNPRFLIDVLRILSDEEVTIYFINSKAPIVIKDAEGKYLYLILPVNIGVN
jgi:DNA polymerase-3 subunit beta